MGDTLMVGAAVVSVYVPEVVYGPVPVELSVPVMVKLTVPVLVGVPDSTPVVLLNDTPAGSVPELTLRL
ncbi:hypothetical protein LMG18101_05257 [Ralstonia flaminis]|uniref:Uncharacterized protein n=1 Tax=Ralstonia flaminis TaxID=3058597 RepID=A0ABN9JSN7_9RALS|nr:hypothetical protein LMG18101_05257 [Ralstonia sp. LMG 18101]